MHGRSRVPHAERCAKADTARSCGQLARRAPTGGRNTPPPLRHATHARPSGSPGGRFVVPASDNGGPEAADAHPLNAPDEHHGDQGDDGHGDGQLDQQHPDGQDWHAAARARHVIARAGFGRRWFVRAHGFSRRARASEGKMISEDATGRCLGKGDIPSSREGAQSRNFVSA
jgi:hypothetical protein